MEQLVDPTWRSLSRGRRDALRVLAHTGPLKISDLTAATGTSQSGMSHIKDGLRARGLIDIEAVDGRTKRVSLTEEGRELVRRVHQDLRIDA